MDQIMFLEKLEYVIEKVLKKEEKVRLEMSTNLIEDLGLNSLSAIEILVHMETIFEIEVDDEDLSMELVETPEKIYEYVKERYVA